MRRCPFLTPGERLRFIYNRAVQAQAIGEWQTAIAAFGKVMPLVDAAADLTEEQRLGTRQSLGYCLHEAGRYAEARAINEKVLAGGERLFGPEDELLLTVLTNLAQNTYKLNDLRPPAAIWGGGLRLPPSMTGRARWTTVCSSLVCSPTRRAGTKRPRT